jgi:hypothetical protein
MMLVGLAGLSVAGWEGPEKTGSGRRFSEATIGTLR